MKRILLIGFIIVLRALIANADDLTFKIALNKDTFSLMEPIYTEWTVYNLTPNQIKFDYPYPFQGNLKYYITGPGGKGWESRGTMDWIRPFYYVLMPNDSFSNSYRGMYDNFFNVFNLFTMPAGEYSLKAVIKKGTFVGQPELQSNEVKFVIKEPINDEKVAYADFIKLIKIHGGTRGEYARVSEMFINKHPNSAYTPYVLHMLMAEQLVLHDYIATKKTANYLVNNFSNLPEGCSGIYYLLNDYDKDNRKKKYFKNKKEGLEYLKTIAAKYPNTRIGKFANRTLKRVEKTGKMFSHEAFPWVPLKLDNLGRENK